MRRTIAGLQKNASHRMWMAAMSVTMGSPTHVKIAFYMQNRSHSLRSGSFSCAFFFLPVISFTQAVAINCQFTDRRLTHYMHYLCITIFTCRDRLQRVLFCFCFGRRPNERKWLRRKWLLFPVRNYCIRRCVRPVNLGKTAMQRQRIDLLRNSSEWHPTAAERLRQYDYGIFRPTLRSSHVFACIVHEIRARCEL